MRELTGFWGKATAIIAALFSLFYLYTAGIQFISSELHRGIYLLLTSILCLFCYPAGKKGSLKTRPSYLDMMLCISAVVALIYWVISYKSYINREGDPALMDLITGTIMIIVAVESARRVVGIVLPILAGIALLYAWFGSYVPGILGHYGSSYSRSVEVIGFSMGGIFGIVVNTYATYIFPFVIFASFLAKSGAGEAIDQIAVALAGGTRGGPAKVAVFSSAGIGSITGSSAANCVATGSYTIPLMIKTGFPPPMAAGIEQAASTGGQFLPPIMGAAAFLISAFTDTPYLTIVRVSIIPAMLYFLAVFMMIDFMAVKMKLKGLPKEEIPNLKSTLLTRGYNLLPIVVLIIVLFMGFSPPKAAFVAVVSTVIISWSRKETRMGFAEIWDALVSGGKNSLVLGATGGVIGIVVGVVSLTGLGTKFPGLMLSYSGGYLFFALILTAIAGYVIGMGVTITATYILLSVIAGPALVELGKPLLTAHLIVFWFCEIGGVTPPVCILAFITAAIAKCKPYESARYGIRLASPLFVIAFLIAYTPITLNGPTADVIETVVSCTFGLIAYAGFVQGCWARVTVLWERAFLGIGALCLFHPNIYTDIVGALLLGAITFWQIKMPKEATV
jgi:TRAP transporter 4TM/12TM fusion protein